MDNSSIDIQKEVSGYTGKMFRDIFGRGPQSVYTSFGYTFITIYLRNFLTPSEKVLLEQDQVMTIQQMRDKLMETIIPELKTYIEIITKNKIREVYYDWNLHNRSAMITCISSTPFTSKPTINEGYIGKEDVNREIMAISKRAEKLPEEIYSCELNERTIVIIRNGILVPIEKELVRLGHGDLLKRVKRNLEKSYLHNNSHFETVLNKQIIDSFVDWDFNLDKSVILLLLNPTEPKKHNMSQVDKE
ncbi:Na-translocating system protein MpsC family protein [Litchfieldia alkalitelluris]|uniref:Na-translocating system protein MpsC family protein n=1 Tax=Litchfieldia alkalitelluris TaxID=304268 RepID=UPI001F43DE9B|nr:Na-translocating system protein MpsC family protein [Litchfieldia alkalitelluris]